MLFRHINRSFVGAPLATMRSETEQCKLLMRELVALKDLIQGAMRNVPLLSLLLDKHPTSAVKLVEALQRRRSVRGYCKREVPPVRGQEQQSYRGDDPLGDTARLVRPHST